MIDRIEQAFPESYRNGDILMIHGDCMDVMEELGEKEVQLSIVDPPYGIGITKQSGFGTFKNDKKWDSVSPDSKYFLELFRISKNQIIWGGNYFIEHLKSSPCFISWNKMNGTNDLADFEIAWTSFESPCRMFSMHHFSAGNEKKIHTCQKPVALYKWLLSRYAKPTDIILDTHGGSGSIVIACHDLGFPIIWVEKDADYYREAVARYKTHALQETLFDVKELKTTQGEIFARTAEC